MRLTSPTLQFVERAGVIDLAWGHPAPAALPVQAWLECQEEALRTYSWRALTYGYAAGPGALIEWLRDRLGRIDARTPAPAEVFVTAGASQALDLLSAWLTSPGDAVLVDSPTYHLALRILADRDVELIGAPADEHGIDPAATAALLRRLADQGRRVPLLYLVPTYGNPTGASLPEGRRLDLIRIAGDAGVVLVEDDAYRELGYDGTAPASLWAMASGRGVVRVGTFSKTVGPGLRLGWFLWLRLPGSLTATELLESAEHHGVSFLLGHRCFIGPAADDHVRLSFSMYEPDLLADAAHRLALAFADAVRAAGRRRR